MKYGSDYFIVFLIISADASHLPSISCYWLRNRKDHFANLFSKYMENNLSPIFRF